MWLCLASQWEPIESRGSVFRNTNPMTRERLWLRIHSFLEQREDLFFPFRIFCQSFLIWRAWLVDPSRAQRTLWARWWVQSTDNMTLDTLWGPHEINPPYCLCIRCSVLTPACCAPRPPRAGPGRRGWGRSVWCSPWPTSPSSRGCCMTTGSTGPGASCQPLYTSSPSCDSGQGSGWKSETFAGKLKAVIKLVNL